MKSLINFKTPSLISISKKHFSLTNAEVVNACKEYTMWSWSAQGKVAPIAMSKAKGCYFWDFEGKKYFDMNSQLMCTNIGHSHPKVIEAIKNQAEELQYAGPGFATKIRAEIGPILSRHIPGDLKKFFFTLGGAESNENAIKFAKFYTNRHKIIARYRSYHGGTQGAMSLTGDPRRWPNEPSLPGVVRIFDPYKYRSLLYTPGMSDEEFSAKMLAQLEETIMYEGPDSIAAIFLETVTGSCGIIPPPNGYLQGVRKICDKYGILMVCDEVMCGVGRTGAWFAVDHWNVVPDILTMAKGLTSGYLPLGCVAVTKKIADAFENKPFLGGLTYQAHPMCLAVTKATLNVMEEEDVVGNAKRMGVVLTELLNKMKEKHPSVGDARCIGLFGALELVKNRKTKEPLSPYGYGSSSDAINQFSKYLKDNGVYHFCYSNVLHTQPPLVVKENELREAFEVIDQGLKITDKFIE